MMNYERENVEGRRYKARLDGKGPGEQLSFSLGVGNLVLR